ncbi:peptidylprolyl isomerase [Methylomagnum ishizawai]|uniref:peptidylprolyl isomerase n=1 Tax=Methylomagnum ishizawai TaxID=1760988 RepID=UPI001C33AAB9|nr:peptidylprolyl isomerase [Methylomagnum ishizawai]BBL76963.1 chaperone SurA [Methylomagnum ishizawai]
MQCKRGSIILYLCGLGFALWSGWLSGPAWADTSLDRIVAVVEDDVVLESELDRKLAEIKHSLASRSDTRLPPDSVLARQVLERLIIEKIQLHLAEKIGIRVDDETLRQAVQQIAQRNKMTPDELRSSLRQEGVEYADFIEQIRGEITVQRLRASQVNSQIKISDREVEQWLAARGESSAGQDSEYLLGHILVATPQAASPAEVQKARERAEKLVQDLRGGLDFKQASMTASDSSEALNGGELGWRKLGQIPSLFTEQVPKMHEGEIADPIRSPSGFHIIKLLGVKGAGGEHITKTHVRHILIRTNEVLTDEDASNKLLALRARIEAGDDFAVLARGHSDDKGSAVKGGDLGWVQPGALVAEFEESMNHLAVNQISEPVQSQFGWHLIQVLGREESQDTGELLKKQARDEIFKRKVEEETELWMRRIRDEAYVEIRLDDQTSPSSYVPETLR